MTISKVSAYLTLCGDMERRERLIERCRFILRGFCKPGAGPKVQRIFCNAHHELNLLAQFFHREDWPAIHQMRDTFLAVQNIHTALIPR